MSGRLEDVQAMVVMLINISHEYLSEDKRNIDYTLKMLIPANYVTKLIGQSSHFHYFRGLHDQRHHRTVRRSHDQDSFGQNRKR